MRKALHLDLGPLRPRTINGARIGQRAQRRETIATMIEWRSTGVSRHLLRPAEKGGASEAGVGASTTSISIRALKRHQAFFRRMFVLAIVDVARASHVGTAHALDQIDAARMIALTLPTHHAGAGLPSAHAVCALNPPVAEKGLSAATSRIHLHLLSKRRPHAESREKDRPSDTVFLKASAATRRSAAMYHDNGHRRTNESFNRGAR